MHIYRQYIETNKLLYQSQIKGDYRTRKKMKLFFICLLLAALGQGRDLE